VSFHRVCACGVQRFSFSLRAREFVSYSPEDRGFPIAVFLSDYCEIACVLSLSNTFKVRIPVLLRHLLLLLTPERVVATYLVLQQVRMLVVYHFEMFSVWRASSIWVLGCVYARGEETPDGDVCQVTRFILHSEDEGSVWCLVFGVRTMQEC